MGMGTSLSFFAAGVPAPSRARFEPTFGPSAVATWCTDFATGLVSGNAALALFFGLPEGMMQGVPVQRLLAAIHPLDIVRVIAAREASVVHRAPFDVVYRVQGRDRERTILARSRCVRDADDRPLQHVGEGREVWV